MKHRYTDTHEFERLKMTDINVTDDKVCYNYGNKATLF